MECCRSSLTPCAAAGPGRGSLAPRNWETFSQLSGFSTVVCNLLIAAQVKNPFHPVKYPFCGYLPLHGGGLCVHSLMEKFWEGPRGHLIQPPAAKRDQGLLPCQAVLGISSEGASSTCLGGLWHLIVVTVDLEVTLLWPFVPLVLAEPSWAPRGSSGDSVPVSDCQVSEHLRRELHVLWLVKCASCAVTSFLIVTCNCYIIKAARPKLCSKQRRDQHKSTLFKKEESYWKVTAGIPLLNLCN